MCSVMLYMWRCNETRQHSMNEGTRSVIKETFVLSASWYCVLSTPRSEATKHVLYKWKLTSRLAALLIRSSLAPENVIKDTWLSSAAVAVVAAAAAVMIPPSWDSRARMQSIIHNHTLLLSCVQIRHNVLESFVWLASVSIYLSVHVGSMKIPYARTCLILHWSTINAHSHHVGEIYAWLKLSISARAQVKALISQLEHVLPYTNVNAQRENSSIDMIRLYFLNSACMNMCM